MGFDLESSSLMDDVMKAFTCVSDNDVNDRTYEHNEESNPSPVSPAAAKNNSPTVLADSEGDDDDESSDSTAGPSSPNEGNTPTESEGEANEESISQRDSSSCSSHGGRDAHQNEESVLLKKEMDVVNVVEVRRQYSTPPHPVSILLGK